MIRLLTSALNGWRRSEGCPQRFCARLTAGGHVEADLHKLVTLTRIKRHWSRCYTHNATGRYFFSGSHIPRPLLFNASFSPSFFIHNGRGGERVRISFWLLGRPFFLHIFPQSPYLHIEKYLSLQCNINMYLPKYWYFAIINQWNKLIIRQFFELHPIKQWIIRIIGIGIEKVTLLTWYLPTSNDWHLIDISIGIKCLPTKYQLSFFNMLGEGGSYMYTPTLVISL